MADVALLPERALIKTSDVDQADWNYRRGPLGHIVRQRYRLATGLLGAGHGSLLEIGYGSGIYMPTLGGLCQKLYGVDVHPYPAAVSQVLAAHGIAAELTIGPAEALPYDEADFDAVVAVSSLEFVQDIDTAMAEVRRVLRPDGIAVFVMPGFSSALDVGLRVLTGHRAEDTFEGRRPGVLPAIRRRFSIDRTRRYLPAPGPAFYTAVRVSRRSHVE